MGAGLVNLAYVSALSFIYVLIIGIMGILDGWNTSVL